MKSFKEHFQPEQPTKTVNSQYTAYRNSKGEFHREDGPALNYKDGSKKWYLHGKFHRTDGPAVIYKNGSKKWWVNGKRHRTDGPAVEHGDGSKEWWVKGKLHRLDGPAIQYMDGNKVDYEEWWINDREVFNKKEYDKQAELFKTTQKGSKEAGLNLDI